MLDTYMQKISGKENKEKIKIKKKEENIRERKSIKWQAPSKQVKAYQG